MTDQNKKITHKVNIKFAIATDGMAILLSWPSDQINVFEYLSDHYLSNPIDHDLPESAGLYSGILVIEFTGYQEYKSDYDGKKGFLPNTPKISIVDIEKIGDI